MLLEQEGPAAGTDLDGALVLDLEDQIAEGLQLCLIPGLAFLGLPSWRPPWQDRCCLLGLALGPLLIGDALIGSIHLAEASHGLAVAPVDVALGDLVDCGPNGRPFGGVDDDVRLAVVQG